MRKVLFVLFLLLHMLPVVACDICGCGVGSYYIGILPEFKKRFIGLRYQQKGLLTHISPSGSTSYLTTNETYRTMELWGAMNFGSRFRVLGFVPVNTIARVNQGISSQKSGLGDVALVGYFKLFNSSSTIKSNKLLVHSLWIGGGVKLPTGKYNPAEKNIDQLQQNTFQLGTGSIDFTFNAMYDIRIMDLGINSNISYKLNTRNKYDYLYGNKFTGNILAYYKFNIRNKITIAPNIGFLYEEAAIDWKDANSMVDASGGYSNMLSTGIELNYKDISLGGNYQSPLSQNLSGNTVKAKDRFMVHVSLSL